MKKYFLLVFSLFQLTAFSQRNVIFTINTQQERKEISPYIYGANQNILDSKNSLNITQNRFGGNRSTSYNWENNFSNAGNDYYFWNDWWLLSVYGLNDYKKYCPMPGVILKSFIDTTRKANVLTMITLPAAGYVAADSFHAVDCTAPCDRWVPTYIHKPGGKYVYPPDLKDNAVYVDEELNWLISMYGKSDKGGVKFYQIDNEPDIWNQNQKYIKPKLMTPSELADLNMNYSLMIKSFDPNAIVFGYVATSWWGLEGWINGKQYLAAMKKRSDSIGKRLIDVFDVHHYPYDVLTLTGNKEWDRLQAPRILWDSTFYIPSKVGPMGWFAAAPVLIKRWQSYIDNNYPGTKLAITEWSSATVATSIMDGLYCADMLGILGRENVYAANHFNNAKEYSAAAFKLFRNYDGNKSTYGEVNVKATTSDVPHATVYASVGNSSNDNTLHIIIINKDSVQQVEGTFKITSTMNYTKGTVYYFDEKSFELKKGQEVKVINNTFIYSLPKRSATHIILKATPKI